MQYHIVTLFPEWFSSPLHTALFAKAEQTGIVGVDFYNPRDYTQNKHNKVDDSPYGGGPGMVLAVQPILDAIRAIPQKGRLIALTPAGEPLTQKLAEELSKEEHLTLICGRYEGFDERLYERQHVCKTVIWEKTNRAQKKVTRKTFWNIPISHARKILWTWKFRKFCKKAIIRKSALGGANNLSP